MEETDNNARQMHYEDVLQQYGECITHVTGWSMEPLLHNRQSIVRVVPAETKQLKVGDVVLYKLNDQYILHRIQKIRGDTLITRGDNNWFLERIPANRILGVMTGFCRRANGRFVDCRCWDYRLYKTALPVLRPVRRTIAKTKKILENLKAT